MRENLLHFTRGPNNLTAQHKLTLCGVYVDGQTDEPHIQIDIKPGGGIRKTKNPKKDAKKGKHRHKNTNAPVL